MVHLSPGRSSEGIWHTARKGTGAEGPLPRFSLHGEGMRQSGAELVGVLSAGRIRLLCTITVRPRARFEARGPAGSLLILPAVGFVLAARRVEGGLAAACLWGAVRADAPCNTNQF